MTRLVRIILKMMNVLGLVPVIAIFSFCQCKENDNDILDILQNVQNSLEMVLKENEKFRNSLQVMEEKYESLLVKYDALSNSNVILNNKYESVLRQIFVLKENQNNQPLKKQISVPTTEDNSTTRGDYDPDDSDEIKNADEDGRDRRLLIPGSTPGTTADRIAFYAMVSKEIANLVDNEIIIMDNVRLDTHTAYHGPSGVFTAPRTGLYAFFSTILSYGNKIVEFEIYKDGNRLAYGHSGNQGDYGTGTAHAIARVNKGERVYIRVHGDDHPASGNAIYPSFSNFMGYSLD